MSQMVERVAKAMRDGMPLEPTWEDWLEQARAAIEEMRKLPPGMLYKTAVSSGLIVGTKTLDEFWDAFIDEALK